MLYNISSFDEMPSQTFQNDKFNAIEKLIRQFEQGIKPRKSSPRPVARPRRRKNGFMDIGGRPGDFQDAPADDHAAPVGVTTLS